MAVKGCRILIVGGGTGGHISPGIALFQELTGMKARAFFLAGKKDIRFPLLESISREQLFTYRAPSMTSNPVRIPWFALSFLLALLKARKIIKKMNINAVVGMGGYVSAPALMAAKMLKIPIFLCEQNSVPGKVNLMFEKHARRIFETFAAARNYAKYPEKHLHTGNPVRKEILDDIRRDDAKKAFHLSHSDKVILVIGGSQGARRLNELVFALKKNYSEEFRDIGLIWITGSLWYEKLKEMVQSEMDEGSIYMAPHIQNVWKAYRASDIAISRGGASVLTELAAMGLPSIIIPYPHAASNHQEINADEFVNAGAAIKILDRDAEAVLVAPVLTELLRNQRSLGRMSEKALKAARRDAAEIIAREIMEDDSCSGNQ